MRIVKVGMNAPLFSMKDPNNKDVSLSDLLKDGWVLLTFYPGDFTPVCTMQWCEYRDHFEEVQPFGVQVIGISSDSPQSHRKFIQQKKLPFVLLSDPGHLVAKMYGMKDLFGMSKRGLVLIDPSGIIQHVTVEVVSLFYRPYHKVIEDLQKIIQTPAR